METTQSLQDMPQSELQAYGNALMQAYVRGGDALVLGAQMTRKQIVADLKSVGAELKARAAREESRGH